MDFKVVMCGCTEMGIDVLNHLLSHKIPITHIVSLNEKQALDWNVSGYSSFDNISKNVVEQLLKRNKELPPTKIVEITNLVGCSAVKK